MYCQNSRQAMKQKLFIHFASILFVTVIAFLIITIANNNENRSKTVSQVQFIPDLSFVDFSNRFETALALDAMNVYFPGNYDANKKIIADIADAQENALKDRLQNAGEKEELTADRLVSISGMLAKFIAIYATVMLLTYYGVQTIGVWRFVNRKSRSKASGSRRFMGFVKKVVLLAGSFVFFCPAYVIAYSLRTEINTDTVFFMIILCVVSNGLLMVYANKFFAFLCLESRKGYVDTAIVKNLQNNYDVSAISRKSIFAPVKYFDGHVFGHIFRNARFQYLSTIKEQASFLITGMIITEMALNLHGYYSYEMLRQMLYGNISIVVAMFLGIFYVVKATEIFVDIIVHREERKYENR
jgi:hypothetical protein